MKPMVILSATVHPLTLKATDLGEVNSNLQLNSMTLHIALSAEQKTEVAALALSLQDPKSPQYHKWLTQTQYGAKFGLTDADLSQLKSWLTLQGFKVGSVSTSRNAITFSGKAFQAESAFHTQLHQYKMDGQTHFANAKALSIPAQFAGVVLTVRGLDTFRPKPNARRIAATFNYNTYNSHIHYLTPGDWATIYGLNTVYDQGFEGTGTHVGVVGQTYAPQSDIDNFRKVSGLPPTRLTYACFGGTTTPLTPLTCTASTDISRGDLFEADLDIEWAGAIAKNATVDYIYVSGADPNNGVFDALTYAVQTYTIDGTVTGPILPVISMSYASCEANLTPEQLTAIDQTGQQASVQGQTLVVASGDSGAAGCDAANNPGVTTAALGLAVNVPADSPNFTAVGGTILSGDETNPVFYWNPTIGLVSSALGYIPEATWNETDTTGLAASGGGESTQFSAPAWQNGLIPATTGRLIPDVAFTAAAGHDGYLSCSSDSLYGTCAPGQYTTANSALLVAGGTSAATPSFAGMLTLFVQRYGPLGNINPNLYQIAANPTSYAAAFNDLVAGDNYVPCVAGTAGCGDTLAGSLGYAAGPGYDLVTGLGSVQGSGMLTAFSTYYPGSVTITAVTMTPTSVVFGNTVTITATVIPSQTTGFTGPVTFTTANGTTLGTVQSVAGVATLSNIATTTANGLIPGSYAIKASYNGGAAPSFHALGYLPSDGAATLVVTPVPVATATTVTASPNSVTIGGTTTLSASVTPTGSTGTVTFKVGSTTIGTPTAITAGGVAILGNVTVSTANGFSVGSDTITASYSGDAPFVNSLGSTTLTIAALPAPAPAPSYKLSASPTSVAGSSSVTLTLTSTNYAGTVSFAALVSSTNGTAANISASALPVTLSSGGTGTSKLTITATANALNHAPVVPWKSGGAVVFCVVLLGAPFGRRRNRALAVLLTALAISLAGFLMACGGGSRAFTPTPSPTLSARTYIVTVTPTGTPVLVTNPAPVTITVTVP